MPDRRQTEAPVPYIETTGMGLSDMRERAAMLGGTVRVESTPGRGTTVDVRIPLAEGTP